MVRNVQIIVEIIHKWRSDLFLLVNIKEECWTKADDKRWLLKDHERNWWHGWNTLLFFNEFIYEYIQSHAQIKDKMKEFT